MSPGRLSTIFPPEARRIMKQCLYGNNSRDRIWELDLIRGLCVFAMIFDHTMYDLRYVFDVSTPFVMEYFHWGVRTAIRIPVVLSFVMISGISGSFSRSNLRRGLQLAGVAAALTLATGMIDLILDKNNEFLITFGILHMLSASILLYCLLKKFLGTKGIFLLALVFITVGIYYYTGDHYAVKGWEWLGLFVQLKGAFFSADYFPLLPGAGFFLLGSILGPILYKEKKSYFGKIHDPRLSKPVLLAGRNALIIYLVHQPLVMLILSFIMFLATGRPISL